MLQLLILLLPKPEAITKHNRLIAINTLFPLKLGLPKILGV